ncbi:calhepatin-like [Protopterus annectens]|uniref:calhepatin-like n=1 Tax=Protopterus annectens TaxID=7888 RepID=UPI001CF93E72|nr:calhepatin-like [Protopterus annectens]
MCDKIKEMQAEFVKADKDNSGTLSVDEIMEALKKAKIEKTRAEVEAIVKHLDFNKDGQVSWPEFLKYLQTSCPGK